MKLIEGLSLILLLIFSNVVLADSGILAINYHHIVEKENDPFPLGNTVITLNQFNDQITWLAENGYKTISAGQLAEYMDDPDRFDFTVDSRIVVITFDDGWADQLLAIPILKKYNYTATFNIISSFPGTSKEYLTWPQIKDLSKSGFEIGSHTVLHIEKPSPNQARDGIFKSKETIEKQIGITVKTIAWPNGVFDRNMVNWAREAKYIGAQTIDQNWCEVFFTSQEGKLSCQWKTGNSAFQNPFYMKRVFIDGFCNIDQFAQIIHKGYSSGCSRNKRE